MAYKVASVLGFFSDRGKHRKHLNVPAMELKSEDTNIFFSKFMSKW